MSWLSGAFHSLFGGGNQPPSDQVAQGYLDKAMGAEKQYLGPAAAGFGKTQDMMRSIAEDPSAYMYRSAFGESPAPGHGGYEDFYNRMMQGYKQSPAFQGQLKQALNTAGSAAAAGGMRGSMSDIQRESDITNRLTNEDMQNWIQNAMGYTGASMGAGQQALGNLGQYGYGASSQLGSDLANIYGQKGQYGFQRQREDAQKAADSGSLLGGLLGVGLML